MSMKIELTNIKNLGTVWLWLGIAVLVLNFAVVGVANSAFWYGLVYGLGFLAVGIVLSAKASALAAVCAGLIGLIAVFNDATLSQYIAIPPTAIFSVVLFALVLASEFGYVGWGGKSESAKYATLAAFAAWFLWPLIYFYQRWTLGPAYYGVTNQLPLETLLYHGGIMLLAGLDFITVLGAVKFKQYHTLRAVFVALAILGAVLVTMELGWSLTLRS